MQLKLSGSLATKIVLAIFALGVLVGVVLTR